MVFDAHDPHSWLAHHEGLQQRQRPSPGDDLERFHEWNLSAGPFVTADTLAVQRAIEHAQKRHRLAALTSRRTVIIDGPPLVGKTYAALNVAFDQTVGAYQAPPPDPTAVHICPWAYVETANHNGLLSIATAIARQVGVVEGGLRNASDYLAAIRHLAPRVGLQGFIIDDSHALSGARSATKSTTLATSLKSLITGIPAVAVIVGANLEKDNILTGTTGEQVRLSAHHRVLCGQWPHPDGRVTTGWERLVKQARSQLVLPDGPSQFQLGKRKAVQLLAAGIQNRPGRAIEWIKEATVHAVNHGVALDQSALEATADLIGASIDRVAT